MSKIKVIRKEPEKGPQLIEIDNTLETFQKEVGGYIALGETPTTLCILCDEEGTLKQKPFNMTACGMRFVGTILFLESKGEEFQSLSDEYIELINNYIYDCTGLEPIKED